MSLPHYTPFYLPTLDALRAEIDRLALDIPLSEDLSVLGSPLAGIPNRFCAQPITGLDAAADGSPGPLTRRRYQRLAGGGFGLIWLEAALAGPAAPAGKLRLHDDTADAFARLVTEIRAAAREQWQHEITIILQLAPAVPADIKELSDTEIQHHLDSLVQAAPLAIRAGIDGIDVHCNGALPGLLLCARTREGEFGGSFDNRSRFLRQALAGIRTAAPGLLLATRLRAYDAARSGFGVDASDYRQPDLGEPGRLVRLLRDAGLDLLNLTAASPKLRGPADQRSRHPLIDHAVPDEHPLQVLARQLHIARSLRSSAPGLPVIGSGFSWLRQFLPEAAAAAITGTTMDLVGLGRAALACPDAPARILTGERRHPAGRVRRPAEHSELDPASTCMVCYACDSMRERGGPVGCPIRDPGSYGPEFRRLHPSAPGQAPEPARRCHLCEAAPCVAASRSGTDIPGFISAWRNGREQRAYEIIRASDVLPEMTARLTPGWLHSEAACIETTLSGSPVPILDLQYEVAWQARQRGDTALRLPPRPSGRRSAIVGAGPAGLAAAIRLLEHGHHVDLHDRADSLGGTPELVIPTSRFPPAGPEIDAILAPAIDAGRLTIHHGSELGADLTLADLSSRSDTVLLATGLWQEHRLDLADRPTGVVDALSFLQAVKRGDRTRVPDHVAIIAGGDCAMDAARCAEQLGAGNISLIFDGPRSELHWHMSGDWFAEPGHQGLMRHRPTGCAHDPDGRLRALRLCHTETGDEQTIAAGLVIEAMGLEISTPLRAALTGIRFNTHGLVALSDGFLTNRTKVFAAGGLTNGGASVARCVAEGLTAADQIHQSLA